MPTSKSCEQHKAKYCSSRAELDCCTNAQTWVEGICLKSRWRRQTRGVSFFFFWPTLQRLTQKSVRGWQYHKSVLRDSHESVYCSLLLWWLYLRSANSWCRLSADSDSFVGIMLTRQRAINNSAFSAASTICGGLSWWESFVWSLESCQRLAWPLFIISFRLTLKQVDAKHSKQIADWC